MRYLRCIGGPRHGSVIGLAGDAQDVSLIDPKSPRSRTRYTERSVHTADGRVHFLAPEDLSDLQAFRIALGPATQESRDLHAEVERLCQILNTPVLEPFAEAVVSEAQHQIYRWGDEQGAKKTAWDWFWSLGYLGGKAAHAALAGDWDKAKHHSITAGALLANWHRHISAAAEKEPTA